jgi:stage II sporulation protein P
MTQSDEEYIINVLKKSPELDPSIQFVDTTRQELRQIARSNRNKNSFYKKSLLNSGLIIGLSLITWITFFSGSQYINLAIQSGISLLKHNIISDLKNEPLVYIYHTHNRESFVSELQITSPEEAQSNNSNKNITSVGKHLSEKLEQLNIKTIVDRTDYGSEPNFSYSDSFKLSRTKVVNTLKLNPSLKMVFDIHRSSLPKEKTTAKINGKDVAKINFVVSRSNKQFQENIKFANKLKDHIVKLYPDLTPQVSLTTESSLPYNQDLFLNSLLIEIGGPENTLEEENLAVDIFAQIVAELLAAKTM